MIKAIKVIPFSVPENKGQKVNLERLIESARRLNPIPWNDDNELFVVWREARTWYSWIDAIMTQVFLVWRIFACVGQSIECLHEFSLKLWSLQHLIKKCQKFQKGNVPSIRKNRSVPDNVAVPETLFSLNDRPMCSFEAHLDDVLEFSCIKSQQLLSSSRDKTVRLWDMECKICLKLLAHDDYAIAFLFKGQNC